jgi:hypothetical protein
MAKNILFVGTNIDILKQAIGNRFSCEPTELTIQDNGDVKTEKHDQFWGVENSTVVGLKVTVKSNGHYIARCDHESLAEGLQSSIHYINSPQTRKEMELRDKYFWLKRLHMYSDTMSSRKDPDDGRFFENGGEFSMQCIRKLMEHEGGYDKQTYRRAYYQIKRWSQHRTILDVWNWLTDDQYPGYFQAIRKVSCLHTLIQVNGNAWLLKPSSN